MPTGLPPVKAAAAPITGPYVGLGAGIDLRQDETQKAIPALLPKRDIHFVQPGFAGNSRIGWGFGNGLRVELEGNYLNDHVSSIDFPDDLPRRAGGYQQQYGGFANVLYDLPLRLPFTPYVGAGIGGQVLEFDDVNSSTPGSPSPGRGGSSSIASFAYQAIAGVAIPVPRVPGLSATLEYDFVGLATGDASIPIHVTRTVLVPGPFFPSPVNPNVLLPFRSYTPERQNVTARQRVGDIFHHSILFGLRYTFNAARSPSPPQAPVVPAAPAPEAARTYLVFFDWDRSTLTPRAREIVAQAAQASTHVQTTRIEVDGYTDTSSIHGGARGASYNQGLSVRRAQTVKAELIHDGVPASAIDIHGYGETHPLVSTGPNQREPQNRRVEIVLH
ncbi:MAG: OmpA family protein [Gluconacetobacter diazotrophicus]|nr:OmpA family protein [Gluconacetobacter diazotrophicus]